ncbi:MAG: transposase, partial [Caldilineaceae bacterium]|nr:transposase [Caldilineaceae bacterium]
MARYGQQFKDRAVARLLLPESAAAEVVAREIGVSVDTLQRWRRGGMSIAIAPMIDTPRRQAARQPLNRRFQALARLSPGSRQALARLS